MFCFRNISYIFSNFVPYIFCNRWFERWKERNQIHFSFGQWLGSVEECCTNKNGKYVQNTGLKIDKNSFLEQESEDKKSGINTNTGETVTLHSIAEVKKIENNNENKKVEENQNLGKYEKRKLIDIDTGDEDKERGGGLEGNKKQKYHNAEEAAMTAGINAVKCQRNSKKGTATFQYNKVRQACLKIPLVYSHRTQRLPPFSSTSTSTSTSTSSNSNCNNSKNDSNSNDDDAVGVAVEVEAAQCKSKEILVSSDYDNCNASYYFPSTDSDQWLCIFKPENN